LNPQSISSRDGGQNSQERTKTQSRFNNKEEKEKFYEELVNKGNKKEKEK